MKRIKYVIELDEKFKKTIDETAEPSLFVSLGSHTIGAAIKNGTPLEEELEKIKTEVNTRKKYIDGDLLFSKIAGHSNYHGDSILSAISCLQEGKEISTIPAIGDNEIRTIDADILEKEIYKLKDKTKDNIERNQAMDEVLTVIAFLLGEIPCSNCANRDKTKIIQNCDEIYKCEKYSHFKAERREQ